QHAAAPGATVVVDGIEPATRRTRIRARVGLEHLAGLGVDHDHAVAWPGAAAVVTAVRAHGGAVGAGEFLGRILEHGIAGLRADLADGAVARLPDVAVRVECVVAAHRRVRRLLHLPDDAPELACLRVEPPDVVRPVLRAPDDVVLVDIDPVRAGQHALGHRWNAKLLDDSGLRIEPADIGAAVRAVPEAAGRIAPDVMGRWLEPRQLIFGDHDPGLGAARPRQRHERRVPVYLCPPPPRAPFPTR